MFEKFTKLDASALGEMALIWKLFWLVLGAFLVAFWLAVLLG